MIFGLLTDYRFVSIRFFKWMGIKIDDHIELKKYSLA